MPHIRHQILSLLIFICTATTSFGQTSFTLKDLFKNDTIIWYGIDYSHTIFSGDFIDNDMNKYFHAWNKLILDEPGKFDIGIALTKRKVIDDIAYVEQRNSEIPSVVHATSLPADSLVTRKEIVKMVSHYEGKYTEGIGLVFIANFYDKFQNIGSHYIVIFDVASKKILLTQKYAGLPMGFGIRNYWAGAIYAKFKTLPSNYKKWKKKYG